jgi:hypothetical protein
MIKIKQNDTKPLEVTLVVNRKRINLTGSIVRFSMRPVVLGLGPTISRQVADITDAANGEVSYAWLSGDTATAGIYRAEFEVTDTAGKVETYPTEGYIDVEIVPDLG